MSSNEAGTAAQEQHGPGADAAASVPMRLVAGSPTPGELAAARVVLEQAVLEQRTEHEQIVNDGGSAWQRSQRPMRMPLTPGHGRWNARA